MDWHIALMIWAALLFIISISGQIASHKVDKLEEQLEPNQKALERIKTVLNIISYIGIGLLLLPVIMIIVFIWYFFCCGFLIFEDTNLWEKILYGSMSILFLIFLLGSAVLFIRR